MALWVALALAAAAVGGAAVIAKTAGKAMAAGPYSSQNSTLGYVGNVPFNGGTSYTQYLYQ